MTSLRRARANLPAGVDGRSATARRFKQLVASFSADLGSDLTEAERALVRQAATVTVMAEQWRRKILASADPSDDDSDAVVRLSNASVRLLNALSAQRKRRGDKDSLDWGAMQAEAERIEQEEQP